MVFYFHLRKIFENERFRLKMSILLKNQEFVHIIFSIMSALSRLSVLKIRFS